MTNEETLKLCILKATKNGYKPGVLIDPRYTSYGKPTIIIKVEGSAKAGDLAWIFKEKIIFSHDFAKAFWGEEKIQVINNWGGYNPRIKWKHFLQQMVLEKNPIQYLKQFL